MQKGQIVYVEHTSEILKSNPLSDPHKRTFPVYVPPSYSAGQKKYPVIFGLAGFTGFGDMYPNKGMFAQPMNDILDALIHKGMPEVIYVMPNCLTKYGGSQYVNSTATGMYDDYITRELTAHIDQNFRTTGRRAVMGGSSGGIGAFWLAANHPDVFEGFADHSGDSAFEYCYLPDVPKFIAGMEKYDFDMTKFIEAIPQIQPKDSNFIAVLDIIAMSACYSPNPEAKPLGFDLPFDIRTGEIKWEIWKKWHWFDPAHAVHRLAGNLKKLKFLYVDCGKQDQFSLILGARHVHAHLQSLNIEHLYEEYNSDHFLLRKEQKKKSIPMLVAALSK